MELLKALSGISGILVTPFDGEDRVAERLLQPIVDRAIAAGVHALVINGNSSEFYSLLPQEAHRMVHAAAEQVRGRAALLGGVGRSVQEACELARASRRAGVDAILVHQPPDPFVAPSGMLSYVKRVADAADGLPLVLYLRNESVGLDCIEGLCRLSAVAGVKWASPTPLLLADAMRRVDDRRIAWVAGLAETWAPALYAVGARGFTSGLINVLPERSVAIHAALAAGDYPLAMRLIDGIRPFEQLRSLENNGANVTVIKSALQLLGADCGAARPPATWPLPAGPKEELRRLLASWDVKPRS
jgi:4-hydroxy-tetrahydrodipicolinate synthase